MWQRLDKWQLAKANAESRVYGGRWLLELEKALYTNPKVSTAQGLPEFPSQIGLTQIHHPLVDQQVKTPASAPPPSSSSKSLTPACSCCDAFPLLFASEAMPSRRFLVLSSPCPGPSSLSAPSKAQLPSWSFSGWGTKLHVPVGVHSLWHSTSLVTGAWWPLQE